MNKFGDEMDYLADEKLNGPDCNSLRVLAPKDVGASSN